MTAVFADTFYFLALVNTTDSAHEKATTFSVSREDAIITTAWVLTELADALCNSSHRRASTRIRRVESGFGDFDRASLSLAF